MKLQKPFYVEATESRKNLKSQDSFTYPFVLHNTIPKKPKKEKKNGEELDIPSTHCLYLCTDFPMEFKWWNVGGRMVGLISNKLIRSFIYSNNQYLLSIYQPL